jgi:hypothetical protein
MTVRFPNDSTLDAMAGALSRIMSRAGRNIDEPSRPA